MKILAFSDIHEDYGAFDVLAEKAKDVDLILCAGDISVFENGIEDAIAMLDSLGKKVLCINGNHESENKMKKICEKTKNVSFIHDSYLFFEGIAIFGYGGGGFSREDDGFERFSRKIEKNIDYLGRGILLTHAPPYGTKLDLLGDHHVGSKSIKRFIEKFQPIVAVSGHIHETFKKTDKVNRTVVVNPGPEGAIIQI